VARDLADEQIAIALSDDRKVIALHPLGGLLEAPEALVELVVANDWLHRGRSNSVSNCRTAERYAR
jgi:hypothetical protein